jgi:hypothetical protein
MIPLSGHSNICISWEGISEGALDSVSPLGPSDMFLDVSMVQFWPGAQHGCALSPSTVPPCGGS